MTLALNTSVPAACFIVAVLAALGGGCGDEGGGAEATHRAAPSATDSGSAAGAAAGADAGTSASSPVEPVFHLTGHTDGVHTVAYSPDGKRILTASHDGTARLWDAASGKELRVLEGHTGAVFSASFSDTGEQVATGGADGMVLVWDADSGELLAMLNALGSASSCFVYGVAFAPDGSVLAIGQDGAVRRYDVDEERQVWAVRADYPAVTSMAVSPDGKLLATGSASSAVAAWDLSTGRPAWRHLVPETDADEAQLMARQRRQTETQTADEEEEETPSGAPGARRRPVMNLVFSPDGSSVYSQAFYSHVHEWDAATGRLVTRHEPGQGALAVDVSPDGQWLLIAASGGLRVWKNGSNPLEPVATLQIPQHGDVHDVAFSPDGRFAAAARGGAWAAGHTWRAAGPTQVPVWDLKAFKPAATSAPARAPADGSATSQP